MVWTHRLDSVHSCLSIQSHVVFKCGGCCSFVVFFKTSLYDCILHTQHTIRCMEHCLAVEVAAPLAVQEISLFVGPGGGLRSSQELATVSCFWADGFSLLSHMHLLSPLNVCPFTPSSSKCLFFWSPLSHRGSSL